MQVALDRCDTTAATTSGPWSAVVGMLMPISIASRTASVRRMSRLRSSIRRRSSRTVSCRGISADCAEEVLQRVRTALVLTSDHPGVRVGFDEDQLPVRGHGRPPAGERVDRVAERLLSSAPPSANGRSRSRSIPERARQRRGEVVGVRAALPLLSVRPEALIARNRSHQGVDVVKHHRLDANGNAECIDTRTPGKGCCP